MKKFILASAFALMGTFALAANAVESDVENTIILEEHKEEMVEEVAPCSSWITVETCATYYLCADNYSNGQQVMDAVEYFDDAKGC